MDHNADQVSPLSAADPSNTNWPAPNKPVDVLRDGNLKANIWRNEGEKGPFYATTFARTFRDKDGQFRDTDSFVAADLLKLAELARESYVRTQGMSRAERREAFKSERDDGIGKDQPKNRDK
jgi:hypothetical protein